MNVLYVLEYDGRIIDHKLIRRLSGIKWYKLPPKKIYFKKGHAEAALKKLPKKAREKTKIVVYVPDYDNHYKNILDVLDSKEQALTHLKKIESSPLTEEEIEYLKQFGNE